MPIDVDETDGYIELKFGPRWKYIAVVRAFIQNFLAIGFSDDARADKIAMAASELLENAVKYAIGEETRIKVGLSAKNGDVEISVSNKANFRGYRRAQGDLGQRHGRRSVGGLPVDDASGGDEERRQEPAGPRANTLRNGRDHGIAGRGRQGHDQAQLLEIGSQAIEIQPEGPDEQAWHRADKAGQSHDRRKR